MIFLHNLALFFHLGAFALYVGIGAVQQWLMRRSTSPALADQVQYEHESTVATMITFAELPSIVLSLLSGLTFIALEPSLLKQPWLHTKLTCVFLLLLLSHLEMFNARKIVKLRSSGAANMGNDIAARKIRHQMYGSFGALLVVVILALVSFFR